MVDEIRQQGSDGAAVHQRHPSQENHHYRMDVLEFVAVGENLINQLQLVVKKYFALSPLPALPQVYRRCPA